MENSEERAEGGRAGGLRPIYVWTQLYQRGAEGGMPQHRSPDCLGGATRRGGATKSSLQTGMEMLANPSEVSMLIDRGGSGVYGYQRGYLQDSADKKGTGVMDIPVDLLAVGYMNGAIYCSKVKGKGVQTEMAGFP